MWFEDEIAPRLTGRAFLVRYADDAVIVLEREEDARRVMDVLPKRFGKYDLTLHAEKTRLVRFKRPGASSEGKGRDEDGEGPGTFDFLGFTHLWVKRKGCYVLKQKMARTRLRRALKAIDSTCKRMRHSPLAEQHKTLCRKLRGLTGYFGWPGNTPSLVALVFWTERFWRCWLARRSGRNPTTWERFRHIRQRYPLPPPRLPARFRCVAVASP